MEDDFVENYINTFDGPTKAHLVKLRALILKVVPDAQALINYNIPAFSLVKGGKREDQIMIAGYKKHVGFYPHPTTVEYFWDQLEDYKKAKGSVQFPTAKALPDELIIEMIKYRKKLVSASK